MHASYTMYCMYIYIYIYMEVICMTSFDVFGFIYLFQLDLLYPGTFFLEQILISIDDLTCLNDIIGQCPSPPSFDFF